MPSFAKSKYAEAIANAVTDAEFKVFDDNQVTKVTTADDANNEVYIAHVTE